MTMDIQKISGNFIGRMNPRLVTWAFKYLKAVPVVRKRLEKEFESLMKDIEGQVKPYQKTFTTYAGIPEKGIERQDILKEMEALKDREESRWKDGFASGAVYHGDEEHIRFLNQVYALNSQTNPLHSDIWPSISKYEGEIVSMTAGMLGGEKEGASVDPGNKVCGVVSSGGTESILLAMKTYRDWARDKKGITRPEMIVPVTAHAAFDKASQYFKINIRHIPVDENYRANVSAAREAITRNTVVMVGSAPSFPHGMVDPIEDLSELARQRGIGFHTDACLGGFVLPWAERLGYDVPPFDFSLPGVTSISADTHKYGYAAKGTSVILYRGLSLRRYQYFKATDWPGGLYFSPTFAGSRSGALSAACWAAMLSVGQEGYLEATKRILEIGTKLKKAIRDMPDLFVLGDPLWVIAFGSKTLDIYRVMDCMAGKNWSLNGLHKPSCVHLCITLRHTRPGVAERFINDLQSAVAFVKENPEEKGGMAPVYGLAATIPVRSIVGDLLERYIDALYKV
jgi:sphinganine-1-phosphate aldolase